MKIDLSDTRQVIEIIVVLAVLYWVWTETGKNEQACIDRGGQVVERGDRTESDRYCRLRSGAEVRFSEIRDR